MDTPDTRWVLQQIREYRNKMRDFEEVLILRNELFLQKIITSPWTVADTARYLKISHDTVFAMLEDAEEQDLFHVNLVERGDDPGATEIWWHAPGNAGLKRVKDVSQTILEGFTKTSAYAPAAPVEFD